MKRLLALGLVVILLLATFTGCDALFGSLQNHLSNETHIDTTNPSSDDHTEKKSYRVAFVSGNKAELVVVEKGKTVPTPTDPVKSDYLFKGWYTDSSFTNRYDFSQPVTQNFTLYAKYEIDAATLTNKISTDIMKGVVKIYNKSYNSFLGIETTYSTSQGSGFCFSIQDGCYYILTNCHVAMKEASYDKQKFTIEDYQGKTYEGYLYKKPNMGISAISAEYDLACLYFKASSSNVKELEIDDTYLAVGADVISLGAPEGQANTITFGHFTGKTKVTLSDTSTSLSNVTFDVIVHDAYINNGSSGGPLLNADLNIVGVNYAGSKSNDYGLAIPAEKILEFLRLYVYN